MDWLPRWGQVPSTVTVLDLVQFCYERVAEPIEGASHTYFDHKHLSFRREAGRRSFRQEVNQIFARNGLVDELQEDGRITRLAPSALREALQATEFRTEDAQLNSLLEQARVQYLDGDLQVRNEGLEKLWDAWERIKTIEPPHSKPKSAENLLNRVSTETNFRSSLVSEAHALTSVGNNFQIRHFEVGKVSLNANEQVDYLFHRMFALIRLLLRSTGRGG